MDDTYEPIPAMYHESLLLFAVDMLKPAEHTMDAATFGAPTQPFSEQVADKFFDMSHEPIDSFWGPERTRPRLMGFVRGIASRIKERRQQVPADPALQAAQTSSEPGEHETVDLNPKLIFSTVAQDEVMEVRRPRSVATKAAAVILALTLAAGPVTAVFSSRTSERAQARTEQPDVRSNTQILDRVVNGQSFILPSSSFNTGSPSLHQEAQQIRERYGSILGRPKVIQ